MNIFIILEIFFTICKYFHLERDGVTGGAVPVAVALLTRSPAER